MLPTRLRRAVPPAKRPDRGLLARIFREAVASPGLRQPGEGGFRLRSAAFRLGYSLTLLTLCALPPSARAQKGPHPLPNYLELTPPDQAEGRAIIEAFRRQGIAGEYYLEFELRVLPRHGAERVLLGRLWGSRNAIGPISRVSVRAPAAGSQSGEVRLLIQSGPQPQIWRWVEGSGSPATPLGIGALFEPVAGTDLTAFDLQMPFLYWPEFVYEGLARMHGRPAHQFLFYPPADVAQRNPALRGVRAYLDTQYTALVQAELIGENDQALKSLSILDLKKIDDQWIVKSVDLREESTRNKTRFAVTAAALNQHFSPAVFEPTSLSAPAAIPDGLVNLTP